MKNLFFRNNNDILKDLGKELRKYRIQREMSQEELSRHSGVAVHTISNIERGKDFSVYNLLSILRSLQLIENLNLLIPELYPNPYDIIKGINERKRVNRNR